MRLYLGLLPAALLGLLASAALAAGSGDVSTNGQTGGGAASATATAPSKPPPAKADPDEVICKYQQTVGTRIPTGKVCHTRAQWDEIAGRDRGSLEDLQGRSNNLTPLKGG